VNRDSQEWGSSAGAKSHGCEAIRRTNYYSPRHRTDGLRRTTSVQVHDQVDAPVGQDERLARFASSISNPESIDEGAESGMRRSFVV
jgi:hypothetical protein